MLIRLLLVSTLLMAICSVFPVAGSVSSEQKAKINAILYTINIDDPLSQGAAENALVKLGPNSLPAMNAVLAELDEALRKLETDKDDAMLGVITLSRMKIDALDGAIIRLSWRFIPREKIIDWTQKLKDFNGKPFGDQGNIFRIRDKRLSTVFPHHLFYIERFRQYPIARDLPEPLASNNLFIFGKDGVLQHHTTVNALETLFLAELPVVKHSSDMKSAVYSWLRISEELAQDGMFTFSIPSDKLKAKKTTSGWAATGKAIVKQIGGNSGEISAVLHFSKAGKLSDVQETRNLHPGIRPICQTTKLLDTDNMVRLMAEQDILVMGRAAESYLLDRRAHSSPELQAAIDKIWSRIIKEGW